MRKRTYDRWKSLFDIVLRMPSTRLNRWAALRIYDRSFFQDANEEKARSAAAVADILCQFYHFETVFDVGCGCGLYLAELARLGKEAVGCDLSCDGVRLVPPSVTAFQADVTRPIVMNRRFDISMCFEVAEHTRRRFSQTLVQNCVSLADRVLFTSAPPGQGGVGHINERPYRFWIDLFVEQSFGYESALSERVRQAMKEADVVSWISNNFMSFARGSTLK